ncbi:uncharacterized protein LOC143145810 [Ptiloglossa arizonensis]|uniref:uncharacterized protein LOC143145810 n=1 Tax=Ptiloglossa arizonensis TaxID=3350558 RepID=UPI003FA05865
MVQDPDENMTKASLAATKIQANFRGYRVRKRMKELKKDAETSTNGGSAGERGISTAKKGNQTKESLEERSATKIQAGVRGFLVRKRQQLAREAATRIQAGFRGFRTRKLLKESEQ